MSPREIAKIQLDSARIKTAHCHPKEEKNKGLAGSRRISANSIQKTKTVLPCDTNHF